MRFSSLGLLLFFACSGPALAHAQLLGPNLVPNPSFESSTRAGLPAHWSEHAAGGSAGTFAYPALPPKIGFKAAQVAITAYRGGEAGWEFAPVAATPGSYTYIDSYRATAATVIEAEFRHEDGSASVADLAVLPPQDTYAPAVVSLEIPAGVSRVTVRHVLRGTGTLTIDDVWFCLRAPMPAAGSSAPAGGKPLSVFALLPVAAVWRRKPLL